MKALVAFKYDKTAPITEILNVSGCNRGRIDAIVERYRYANNYKYSETKYNFCNSSFDILRERKGKLYTLAQKENR